MIDPLFDPSAIAVLKQVSGLPKSVRDRQQLLALQAFIDDSRSEGAILVLSGYIADAASWAKFSDEWQELLNGLRWDEFKMARLALGGGDETTERAEWFYRVIERHVLAQVSVAVSEKSLNAFVDELKLPPIHRNPYLVAYWGMLDLIIQRQRQLNFWEPIDIIFDDYTGMEAAILTTWNQFRERGRSRHRRMMGSPPRFVDSKRFLPLQAADLSAWWLRRYWQVNGNFKWKSHIYPWDIKKSLRGMLLKLNGPSLKSMLLDHKREYMKQTREAAVKRGMSTEPEIMWEMDDVWDFRTIITKLQRG